MSCAAERSPPRSGYFEFEAQPDEDDPVDADRGDREDQEEADVQVGRRVERRRHAEEGELRPPRDEAEDDDGRGEEEERPEEVEGLLRPRRDDVFLEDRA